MKPLYYSDDNRDGEFDDVDCCRRAAAERSDLDTTGTGVRGGRQVAVSLCWIYVQMIEEYARHNGHADLLRERIDGVTGS